MLPGEDAGQHGQRGEAPRLRLSLPVTFRRLDAAHTPPGLRHNKFASLRLWTGAKITTKELNIYVSVKSGPCRRGTPACRVPGTPQAPRVTWC